MRESIGIDIGKRKCDVCVIDTKVDPYSQVTTTICKRKCDVCVIDTKGNRPHA